MANEDNLKPFNKLTESEQREITSMGGKASVSARRKNKSIRAALVAVLKGIYDIDGEQVSGYDAIAIQAFKEAINGNIKAFVAIRDTIGEKPTDKTESSGEIKIIMSEEVKHYGK